MWRKRTNRRWLRQQSIWKPCSASFCTCRLKAFPPGYLAMQSYKHVAAHKKNIMGGAKMETLMETGVVIVDRNGAPEDHRMP